MHGDEDILPWPPLSQAIAAQQTSRVSHKLEGLLTLTMSGQAWQLEAFVSTLHYQRSIHLMQRSGEVCALRLCYLTSSCLERSNVG